MVRSTNAGRVQTFGHQQSSAASLCATWREILDCLALAPPTDWPAFEKFTAREMTRRQCEFFDRVIGREKP